MDYIFIFFLGLANPGRGLFLLRAKRPVAGAGALCFSGDRKKTPSHLLEGLIGIIFDMFSP